MDPKPLENPQRWSLGKPRTLAAPRTLGPRRTQEPRRAQNLEGHKAFAEPTTLEGYKSLVKPYENPREILKP